MSHKICIGLVAGYSPLEVGAINEVFLLANQLTQKDFYEVNQVALENANIIDKNTDTLFISGRYNNDKNARITNLLTSFFQTNKRIVTFGESTVYLANTGLLDERRATSHYTSIDTLKENFPAINVVSDSIYVQDGPFYTSSGFSASIHLCLSLVEQDLGATIALEITQHLVLPEKRTGDSTPKSPILIAQSQTTHSRFDKLLQWIGNNIEKNITVSTLAEKMSMSERNFSRVFCKQLKISPKKYINKIRCEKAIEFLKTTDLNNVQISELAGFNSPNQMRRILLRFEKMPIKKIRNYSMEMAISL